MPYGVKWVWCSYKVHTHITETKTILQVEDDLNDVLFLRRAMEKVGVANPIQIVTDGQEAIDYLQGAGKFFDRVIFPFPCLVLLALKLPYVMGLDVLKWIRNQPGTVLPVVILSASAHEADIAGAYRLGANAFLRKPFESRQLVDIAKAIKDFWLTHNTLPKEPVPKSPMEAMVARASLRSLGRPLPGTASRKLRDLPPPQRRPSFAPRQVRDDSNLQPANLVQVHDVVFNLASSRRAEVELLANNFPVRLAAIARPQQHEFLGPLPLFLLKLQMNPPHPQRVIE